MQLKRNCVADVVALSLLANAAAAQTGEPHAARNESFVDNQGGKLHCVSQGSGQLVVMIHGFPDFWYSWRDQMSALAPHFQVVAYDQRGYNLSDQPVGVENDTMQWLVSD